MAGYGNGSVDLCALIVEGAIHARDSNTTNTTNTEVKNDLEKQ